MRSGGSLPPSVGAIAVALAGVGAARKLARGVSSESGVASDSTPRACVLLGRI